MNMMTLKVMIMKAMRTMKILILIRLMLVLRKTILMMNNNVKQIKYLSPSAKKQKMEESSISNH